MDYLDVTTRAIHVNIAAMRRFPYAVLTQSDPVGSFYLDGKCNKARAAMAGLGAMLDEAKSLHDAAIALDRMHKS